MSQDENNNDAFVGFCVVAATLTFGAWLIGFGTIGGWIAAGGGLALAGAWKLFAWTATLALTTVLQAVATGVVLLVGGVLAKRYLPRLIGGKLAKLLPKKKTVSDSAETDVVRPIQERD